MNHEWMAVSEVDKLVRAAVESVAEKEIELSVISIEVKRKCLLLKKMG